jgi:hypothetical protein
MSETLQLALKRALIAAFAAGFTVFLREYRRDG